ALPFEVHIPGYQFCGPGTRLVKRLARGNRGINRLDAACREHDIAYSRCNHLTDRHIADRVLAERARERITASDSTFGEKAVATAVWAAMKAKTKLGMGMKRRKRTKRKTTSGNETWRYPTDFTNVRCVRIFDWWSGERNKSCERSQGRSTSVGGSWTVSSALQT
ncbi:hypothetical protein ALC57_05972, partial [Trachymyrmex cornetzi]